MEGNIETTEPGLFDDHITYETASTGQRFVNWLVDNILLRLVITYLTGNMLINFLLEMAPEFTYRAFADGVSAEGYIVSYLFAIFHYLFYYTICEKAFKGYTLGKLLSGTRAIRADGQELAMKDAILRSLSRMVPFEVFSGFGTAPWHDVWTKTTVVKAR
jgi:uncharacterized RDD family membrane protein YckC